MPLSPAFGSFGFFDLGLDVLTVDFGPLLFRLAGVALPVVLLVCECVADRAGPPTSLALVARVVRREAILGRALEAVIDSKFKGAISGLSLVNMVSATRLVRGFKCLCRYPT